MQYKDGIWKKIYEEAVEKVEREQREAAEQERAAAQAPPEAAQPPEEQIISLPLNSLEDFPQELHPFHPASEKRIEEIRADIVQNGILAPLLVRDLGDGRYQILAGHTRKKAAELAHYETVPCIIKQADDEEAINIMLSDNLLQREELLPSEKAFAYKMRLEAMKRQAGRPRKENGGQLSLRFSKDENMDVFPSRENSVPSGHHSIMGKSRELLATNSPDSNTQIQRYIRLTFLSKDLLQKVDEQAIGLQIGATLSYLTAATQELIFSYYFVDHKNQHIDQALADELRTIDADPAQELTVAVLDRLAVERAERRFKVVKIQMKNIRKYFQPDVKKEEVAKVIEEALDFYYSHRQLGNT